ncbi:MAG: MBOAT family O-acyltransferase [Chitinophagales bacterium]|nr:MBOAT family protein [Chitinophagales bacterium]
MLFNSIDFAVFLPIVFALYWLIKNTKAQNVLIVIVSYIFYGWWDWRFLILIAFSTLTDFFVGKLLQNETEVFKRKILLAISIVVNIGMLAFFKYANFFIQNFAEVFTLLGKPIHLVTLNIILPVGISFYTFQTLSYTIDVYRKKIKATQNIVAFTAFVSFFPQLVAGPIERAKHLLPQFLNKRTFSYNNAVVGLRQILWGLFKKVVIADSCAIYADYVFQNYETMNGSALVMGAFFFAIQIYGDFSGYTDMAIGIARLFGIDLMQNFAFPYFSRDIAEFWRRWHISLTTWFRDYIYIPLGGSRVGKLKTIRNVFIIFILSGFWHGANWTFIAWGALNALYFLPLLLLNKNRENIDIVAKNNWFPSIKEVFSMGLTFAITVFAWIFFRANSMKQAYLYISGIFSHSILLKPNYKDYNTSIWLFFLIVIFMAIEWLGRRDTFAIEKIGLAVKNVYVRYFIYTILLLFILWNISKEQTFIYFQF